MKKIILVIAFAVMSLGVFAYGGNENGQGRTEGKEKFAEKRIERRYEARKEMLEKLTDEQKKELEKTRVKFKKEKQLKALEMKEKDIEIKKLLLEENVNWNKIENAIKDKNDKKSEMELYVLKHKFLMKEKFGIDIPFEYGRDKKQSKFRRNRDCEENCSKENKRNRQK